MRCRTILEGQGDRNSGKERKELHNVTEDGSKEIGARYRHMGSEEKFIKMV